MALTNAGIIDRVQAIIRDTTNIDATTVIEYLNNVQDEVAGEVLLPELATSDSVATSSVTMASIAITAAAPVSIAYTTHGLNDGDRITFNNLATAGTELNGNFYTVSVPGVSEFTLDGTIAGDVTGGTASAGTYSTIYADLPSDYHRNLHHCITKTYGRKVPVIQSWHDWLKLYPELDQSGPIDLVCVRDKRLYYMPVPASSDTLHIYYYRLPTAIADNALEPDIPEAYRESVLIRGATSRIFEQMGLLDRADREEAKFNRGMEMLRESVPIPEGRPPTFMGDDWG
jgi:hypothetical protein